MRRRGEIAVFLRIASAFSFSQSRMGVAPNESVSGRSDEFRERVRSSIPDRHRLTAFFDVIVTGEEVECGKPHPDIYLRTAEKLGIPADACLVIEDALSGIAAAKAAGMRVAAIPDTRFVGAREYEKQADYLLGTLSEIVKLVRRVASAGARQRKSTRRSRTFSRTRLRQFRQCDFPRLQQQDRKSRAFLLLSCPAL